VNKRLSLKENQLILKMNKVLCVGVMILVAACSCNALYYFKQKSLDYCDVSVTFYAQFVNSSNIISGVGKAHGDFVFGNISKCSIETGKCDVSNYYLIRPDLADSQSNTKFFNMTAISRTAFDCDVSDFPLEDTPEIRIHVEGYFERREEAVFHGIKCFKFSQSSYPYSSESSSGQIEVQPDVYGDDATGELFGVSYEGSHDIVLKFSTPSFEPSEFTFRGIHDCSYGCMDDPDKVFWKQTCKRYPSSL